jgi:Polyketide cyclase / dehydrase and lipid transport
MSNRSFPFHDESSALVHATIDQVFAHLDDPMSLAAHMGRSSMRMMGSRMSIEVDADGGRHIGSKVRMHGRMMGIPISLEEMITERQPPSKKFWETIGTPRLLVLAHYRMGFEVTPQGDSSLLRVLIDYNLPTTAPGSWLGRVLGPCYAHWCTTRMSDDAASHLNSGTANSL